VAPVLLLLLLLLLCYCCARADLEYQSVLVECCPSSAAHRVLPIECCPSSAARRVPAGEGSSATAAQVLPSSAVRRVLPGEGGRATTAQRVLPVVAGLPVVRAVRGAAHGAAHGAAAIGYRRRGYCVAYFLEAANAESRPHLQRLARASRLQPVARNLAVSVAKHTDKPGRAGRVVLPAAASGSPRTAQGARRLPATRVAAPCRSAGPISGGHDFVCILPRSRAVLPLWSSDGPFRLGAIPSVEPTRRKFATSGVPKMAPPRRSTNVRPGARRVS